jgi:hypothetical protein
MQEIIETEYYLKSVKYCGMTDPKQEAVKDYLARNPEAGDLIIGSGGCRKVRIAGKGKGKSGGYRIITFFACEDFPLVLLWAISKGQDENVNDAQVNGFAKITSAIKNEIKRNK